MTLSRPVRAKPTQGRLWQGHERVLGPLAAVGVNHRGLAVDVVDLQMPGLLDTQTAGEDGGEEGAVLGRAYGAEHDAHLLNGGHRRETLPLSGLLEPTLRDAIACPDKCYFPLFKKVMLWMPE